jgi:probable addiction module antidote protein
MKKADKSGTISWDDYRRNQLENPERAKVAIEVALEEFEKDNDVEALLNLLRLVAQAQGGLARLARRAEISRQALHEALSPRGNPRLRTFQSVLGSLGLRMAFKPVRAVGKRAKAAKVH